MPDDDDDGGGQDDGHEEYMKRYMMQSAHQQQTTFQPCGTSQTTAPNDVNGYYYDYYMTQAAANPELHGISGAANYEHQRGLRQMGHYFDVGSMPTAIPSIPASQKPKPSAAQLQYYREQRERRRRIKNKWLYE